MSLPDEMAYLFVISSFYMENLWNISNELVAVISTKDLSSFFVEMTLDNTLILKARQFPLIKKSGANKNETVCCEYSC